jgi:signal transduction histidine kinase
LVSAHSFDRPLKPATPIRLSLRWQLVATFLAINFLTLAVVSALDAWLASRRTRAGIERQLNELVGTVSRGTYQLNDQVLEQIAGLSGAQFVLKSSSGKTIAASDREFDSLAQSIAKTPVKSVTLDETVTVQGRAFFHTAVELKRSVSAFEKQTLHIFYSTEAYNSARRDAMTPPLLVALGILPLTALVVLALARRIAAPIAKLREQVARISSGDYAVAPVESGTREVRDLSQSVHQMAGMLEAYTQETRKAERLKALAQVNASLIHQLRNSLAGCRLAIDIHIRKCGLPHDESLEMATRQLQQIADYVNRFVQVEGQAPVVREIVGLCEVLQEVLALARPTAEHLGVRLRASLPEENLKLLGDRQSLRQAMTNLVNNALEATAEYHASGVAPEVIVRLEESAGKAVLEIGDTGPGVPDEIARQLFEPFATGKPEGLGLGLFVAKSAAEAHAGKIETRRENGLTWFVMTLPLEKH